MWGLFFGEFQCLPVDDCPAASCDSGFLTRESESTSFYSAILVPIPQNYNSLLNSNKPIFDGEITGNLFVLGQQCNAISNSNLVVNDGFI